MNIKEAHEILHKVEKRPYCENVFWASMISDEHIIREAKNAYRIIYGEPYNDSPQV